MKNEAKLKKALNLPLLIFYGVGTMLGAGIYVLIGKVAGASGMNAPLAFLISALIAGFTGLSYAELSSRFPKSAGEAFYVRKAFGVYWLEGTVGWMVIATGIVSTATMARGFAGYLQPFVTIGFEAAVFAFIVFLTLIAIAGIVQSVASATIMTIIEVGGLILILVTVGDVVPSWTNFTFSPTEGTFEFAWTSVFLGAFLAFYAFIGFEDIVNVAEEVKNPQRDLPLAIFLSVIISTILYWLVAKVAVHALDPAHLAQSSAPFADIIGEHTAVNPMIISIISLIAISNGALVQVIMASRVLYGIGQDGLAPKVFRKVHPRTRTPIWATLFVGAVVIFLGLLFPLENLAKGTSLIMLMVFSLVNLSLIVLRLRHKELKGLRIPLVFVFCALVSSFGMMVFQIVHWIKN